MYKIYGDYLSPVHFFYDAIQKREFIIPSLTNKTTVEIEVHQLPACIYVLSLNRKTGAEIKQKFIEAIVPVTYLITLLSNSENNKGLRFRDGLQFR